MILKFNYDDEIESSAAVESNIRKMKILTFEKYISLPSNIENFIEHHIASLKGTSLLRSSNHAPILNLNTHKIDTDEDYMIDLMDTTDLMMLTINVYYLSNFK
jgi:hypothetical protein